MACRIKRDALKEIKTEHGKPKKGKKRDVMHQIRLKAEVKMGSK